MRSRRKYLSWILQLVVAAVISFALIWLATAFDLPMLREAGGRVM
jgi:hypothetical protein